MTDKSARIAHIDAIRGFMMLLVIYGHTFFFLTPTEVTELQDFFLYFRMPLFFFIAGFFLYNNNYSADLFKRRGTNRLLKQFYPTVIFWALFCFIFSVESFPGSWLSPHKQGYWFTYVSVEMFFLTAPILMIFSLKNFSRIYIVVSLIVLSLVLQLISLAHILPATLSGFFSFDLIARHFPYLVLGIISRMYVSQFNKLSSSIYGLIICTAIFCLFYIGKEFFVKSPALAIIRPYILAFTAIIIVNVLFFYIYKSKFLSSSFILKGLSFIGTATLEIYLLHYFVIFGVKTLFGHSQLFVMLDSIANTPYEFPITIAISVLIAIVCLSIIRVLKLVKVHGFFFPSTPPPKRLNH